MKRLIFGGIVLVFFACANDNGNIDCATGTDLSDNLILPQNPVKLLPTSNCFKTL